MLADRSSIKRMGTQTRERIVRRGAELLTEFSFSATGLGGLLQSAGVPKGSFYHFFPSKQDFALAVIAYYDAYFEARSARILRDPAVPPLDRLQAWMAEARKGMARHGWRRGCLIGNLSQELGPHDAVLRDQLRAVFRKWEGWIETLLQEARDDGDIAAAANPKQLAQLFWIGWEGAILRAKVERSGQPMDAFAAYFLQSIPRLPAREKAKRVR